MKVATDNRPHNNIATQMSIDKSAKLIPDNLEKTTKYIANIQNLPAEIHHKISSYLDPISYANTRETCHALKNNLEPFNILKEISTNERCQGELKERAIHITLQRELLAIKNDRDIMATLTNLKLNFNRLAIASIYSIEFMTNKNINQTKKEQLHATLLMLKKLCLPENADSYCARLFDVHIGFNIMSYGFHYIVNRNHPPISSTPPIKEMIESLQSEWDKNKKPYKYLIAAIAEKIVNFCEKKPSLGVNKATLAVIRNQHAQLISSGKIINTFAKQHQTRHIDYLSTNKITC